MVVVLTIVVAWFLSSKLRDRLDASQNAEDDGTRRIRRRIGSVFYPVRELLFPAIGALLMGVAVAISGGFFHHTWLVKLVQGFYAFTLVLLISSKFVHSAYVKFFMNAVVMPIIALYAFSVLDDLIAVFDGVILELGSIKFTLYGLIRTAVFGILLFWIGRLSNTKGQDLIRTRASLDDTTRELALKSFQVALVVVFSLLFLQVAGIDLTALVVFGGAIGVGLGFGLQQIASNFISGVIILLDRSIAIGDFIELEDGRSGVLRELGMRSAILETYDGKDIMVPNEKFITTAFVNWTHHNQKQRYPINFEVAYGTDLEKLFDILREVVASHPRVLSGEDVPFEERPDAEIASFAESGIEILVEFWMEGVDDGKNRVGADLLFMIWKALQDNGIEIPYPHRVITIEEKKAAPAPRKRKAPAAKPAAKK
ncbi:MAG TPA: mechanosensitive ion channel protein [Rhodospirillaceae bacterium]|nr:mechanosensitive ion channel protein [Rhodospirillaceae bacterium]